ncbi:hypothetical protein OIU85_018952 [Salix viminalis]|uniref:Uncharacterized protein n=1 Tax=Salix viminalis TaxID=40686 RepID=A0A9Q0UUT5_SALVM|nr:hypothetical protein OIU85_018952 [Salix viminalis]
MYKQALELLSQALEVWPNANVKFNYLEKLLNNMQPSQSKDPSTALAQGLDVMNKVLEKQPHLFIRNNINQISQILEPCFKQKMLDAGKSLCSLLKMVFVAFPPDVASTPSDVKLLYQKVDDLIQKHIDSVTSPQTSGEDTSVSSISFVLLVIKTLTEVGKYIEPPILVRILQRLARDMGSSAGSHLRQALGVRTPPPPIQPQSQTCHGWLYVSFYTIPHVHMPNLPLLRAFKFVVITSINIKQNTIKASKRLFYDKAVI